MFQRLYSANVNNILRFLPGNAAQPKQETMFPQQCMDFLILEFWYERLQIQRFSRGKDI